MSFSTICEFLDEALFPDFALNHAFGKSKRLVGILGYVNTQYYCMDIFIFI